LTVGETLPFCFERNKAMPHSFSHDLATIRSGTISRSVDGSISKSTCWSPLTAKLARNLCLTLLVVSIALLSSSFAQLTCPPNCFTTSRGDNARDGANTNETILTPANVNVNVFGRIFSVPIDYYAQAQPLYMPNISIPGQGTHNVVYVVTQMDSVYAFDADSGAQLWWVNFTDPAQGITLASKATGTLPCTADQGFVEEGIPGTPVIDPTTNTIYLVAKTVVNGTVLLNLHALNITTGSDLPGSPVLIQATSTSKKGHITVFDAHYEKQRPGLLLLNGVLYIGFGSNGCNGKDQGWLLAYDEATLAQVGAFNTSPDYGLVSIWQSGNGIAADEAGNIFFETAESAADKFDVPEGGQTYCNSVVKLSPSLEVLDYFTPYDVAFLNKDDLDLSSSGVLILPDQGGPTPHELVAAGKQGFVYLLNRDDMGMYAAGDSGALQEFPLIPGEGVGADDVVLYGAPAYWNNTVYFDTNGATPTAYPVLGSGLLGNPLPSPGDFGGHSPSVSSNGNNNGVLWVITGTRKSGAQLIAFTADTVQTLYNTKQAPNGRDTLAITGDYATQTVINGKVYIATATSLEAYGLLQVATLTGGNGQTATVGMALAKPIQVQASNPYTGQVDAGATVTFSDGCTKAGSKTCGSFNPPSAVTNSSGNASTIYTVPEQAGTYTITISGSGFGNTFGTATAAAGAAVKLYPYKGGDQSGAAGSTLANPILTEAFDTYGNAVPGVTVNFAATKGAVPNPSTAVTGSNGLASTVLQLPDGVAKIIVTASSAGLKNIKYTEYSVAGPAANIAITSGNNQSGPAGSQLPQALTVLVTDQYGNPVSGNSVNFSDGGAGGTFSNPNPVVTGANGMASVFYTLPGSAGTVTIDATATGVANPAVFTETAQ
jgi:hypothetical protein